MKTAVAIMSSPIEPEKSLLLLQNPGRNPLNGLRGFLSLYITVHHALFYSPFNLNIMGAVSYLVLISNYYWTTTNNPPRFKFPCSSYFPDLDSD